MMRSAIVGIGSYVPPKVVTNDDLAQRMTTSDEWIQTRTGIRERRFADEGVKCSDLALEACRNALDDAGMTPADIDFLIFATLSPDHHFPGTACYLQPKLGTGPIGCLDVRNQCTGFLYSLTVADALIRAGVYKNILIVGAEVHSSALDFSDRGRDVAVLFGDAPPPWCSAHRPNQTAVCSTRNSTPTAASPGPCVWIFGTFRESPTSRRKPWPPRPCGRRWTARPSSSMR